MNRRQYLATIGCGASAFLSGCLNDPGAEGGLLEALEVGKPPNASVTAATNDRISGVAPVQEVIQHVSENESGVGEVEVSEREYDSVAQALSNLPWYDRNEHDSSYPSGVYIQREGKVFVVVLTPFCTDSMFVDAQSDRGEYGWGGCINKS
jgi:hypothetical protein